MMSPSRGVDVEVTEEVGGEDTLSPSRGVEVEATEEEGGEDTLHNYIRKRSIHRVTSLTLFLLYIILRGHIGIFFFSQIKLLHTSLNYIKFSLENMLNFHPSTNLIKTSFQPKQHLSRLLFADIKFLSKSF